MYVRKIHLSEDGMKKKIECKKIIMGALLAVIFLTTGSGVWLYRYLTYVPECKESGFSRITINKQSGLHSLFGVQPPSHCKETKKSETEKK